MYPVIFQSGPIIIFSLWFFAAIGLVAAVLMYILLAKWKNLHFEFLFHHTFSLAISTLLFSRIFYVVRNWMFYFEGFNTSTLMNILAVWDKGLSFWGALFGFLVVYLYICKRKKEHFKRWLDIIVISILTAIFFGKIGSFLDGSAYGIPTSLPWGIMFESPSVKYAVPIHPTQIYSMIYILIIFLVLLFLYFKKKLQPGLIAYIGIVSYSFFSFLEGFLRGDDMFMFLSIREDQYISLFIIITSTILYFRYNKPKDKKTLNKEKNE